MILEDLDRTQNYEVFTHLRNLNFVLNNRLSSFAESRSQRSRIVFIYLLDDCIFSNPEELVKFFDYSVSILQLQMLVKFSLIKEIHLINVIFPTKS